MSASSPIRRLLPPAIRARKGGERLVMLTACTAPVARLVDSHCDMVLVGDSVGMVLHGMPSTLGVTMEMMILHGRGCLRKPVRLRSSWTAARTWLKRLPF